MESINKSCKKNTNEKVSAADLYSGVAIDISDDEKVTKSEVKDRTQTLNNNPRNNDLD